MVHRRILASSTIAAALALAACGRSSPPFPAGPPDAALAGDWSGSMPVQPPQHIIFHVRKTTDGSVETTMDVPERRLSGFPALGPVRDGGKVDFAIPSVRFRYEAVLDPDGRTLRGTITQGAAPPLPVVLTRTAG